jgi:hypothetical protein
MKIRELSIKNCLSFGEKGLNNKDYLGAILDPRLRQRLFHQLWQEVTE